MSGFIRIYRDALDTDLLYKPYLLQVWMYLNMQARYVRTVQDGVEILPGQLLLTAGEIAHACRLKENNVRYALACLEKRRLIRCENIRNRHSLITILNPAEAQTAQAERVSQQPTVQPQPQPQPQKECCGICMNVYLTKEEKRTLQERSPAADNYIDNLSAYKRRTGKEYKEDFPVLIEWMCKDEIKKTQSDEPPHDEPPRIRQDAPKREQAGPQYDRHGLTTTTSYDLELAEYIARTSVPVLRKRNRAGG